MPEFYGQRLYLSPDGFVLGERQFGLELDWWDFAAGCGAEAITSPLKLSKYPSLVVARKQLTVSSFL
jgi:hypothetical protein